MANLRQCVVDAYDVLRLLKVQLLVSVVALVVLVVPGQILEVYRIMAEDLSSRWFQIGAAILGLGFLTFMIWYSGRWITLSASLEELNKETCKTTLLQWTPRVLAILPATALALHLIVDPRWIADTPTPGDTLALRIAGGIILILTLCFLILVVFRTQLFDFGVYRAGVGSFHRFAIYVVSALPVLLLVSVILSPVRIPEWLGTLFFVCVFLGVIVFLLSSASLFHLRTGFPLTMAVIGLAVVLSVADLNDNHRVRTVPANKDNPKEITPTKEITPVFIEWLGNRKDIDFYKDRGTKYPIYIIAAEGGGIYAAHHAAMFLSRMQDICPAFAQHVFAISGVSGGSVGSGIFAGLLQPDAGADLPPAKNGRHVPCVADNGQSGPYESLADDILAHDLLSPLVAATLTTDFVQRFLPGKIEPFDRARALETAVRSAWNNTGLPEDRLESSISSFWRTEGAVPALVLNTTLVETGERVAASPFALVWPQNSVETLDRYSVKTLDRYFKEGEDISVLSAATLSARFTYITPAGWLGVPPGFEGDERNFKKVRFVDGGYFENSGIDTAMDMVEALRHVAEDRGAEIRLISLQYATEPKDADYSLGEALSPVRALMATRVNRGRLAHRRAVLRLVGDCSSANESTPVCDTDRVRVTYIHDGSGKLPLGWLISKRSRDIIKEQISWPSKCMSAANDTDAAPNGINSINHRNACVMKSIQTELNEGIASRKTPPAEEPQASEE